MNLLEGEPRNDCSATNSDGDEYMEFSCLYPSLGKTYMSWEKYYDPIPVMEWMQAHSLVPIAAVVLYAVAILAGKSYFASRDRWNWRYSLAAWNLALSLFSWVGMIRTLPALLHMLLTMSLKDTMCRDPKVSYGSGSTGLWVQLFILSKFPELLDTLFIIIHKKKLIFLHWYHHMTVLLYCWHSYVMKAPYGIFFVVMNYTVHATMYGYYCLMAMRMRPKWFNPMVVTAMQISQMIIGVGVTMAGFYYFKTYPDDCSIQPENNTAAFVMYGSYLFLFLQFFVGRYVHQHQPKKTKSA